MWLVGLRSIWPIHTHFLVSHFLLIFMCYFVEQSIAHDSPYAVVDESRDFSYVALLIIALISASVPHSMLTMLFRQVNSSISSMLVSFIFICCLIWVLIIVTYLFSSFGLSSSILDVEERRDVILAFIFVYS